MECDVGSLWLIKDQMYCYIQDHLQRFSYIDCKACCSALQQSSLEITRAWTKSCDVSSDMNGLIFLML